MTEDRKMGLLWGFSTGVGFLGAFTVHPVMIVFSVIAVYACWRFGKLGNSHVGGTL